MNSEDLKKKSFGEILRQERKKHGINTVQLGKIIGCTRNYISQVETGVKLPSKDIVKFLLGISEFPEELILQKAIKVNLEFKEISLKKKQKILEQELLNVRLKIEEINIFIDIHIASIRN